MIYCNIVSLSRSLLVWTSTIYIHTPTFGDPDVIVVVFERQGQSEIKGDRPSHYQGWCEGWFALVRDTDTDPDPSIIKQNSKKNIGSYCFVTSFDFLSLKYDVNVPSKSNKQKTWRKKNLILLTSWRSPTKIAGPNPDPLDTGMDPHQNFMDTQQWKRIKGSVMDPERWLLIRGHCLLIHCALLCSRSGRRGRTLD